MTFTITNKSTGEICTLARDVCTIHPAWVHEQTGTADEIELQAMLDQYDIGYYYDSDGEYRGADILGIDFRFDSPDEATEYGFSTASPVG